VLPLHIFALPQADGTSVPIGSVRGIAHLLVVAAVILTVIVAATVLLVVGKAVPDFFTIIGASGFAYLIGVNAGIRT
jgi:hypothetical protein